MKFCTKCKKLLPIDNFGKNKYRKDGLSFCCKECRKSYDTNYRRLSYHIVKETHKKYRERNRVQIRKRARIWNKENYEYIKEYKRKWKNRRINNDINYKISQAIRYRVYLIIKSNIKSNIKSKRTIYLIGCSVEFLKEYLESKFEKGMVWDNWGRGKDCWHIDHIKPLNLFNLSIEEELLEACNYANLQPLWEFDNLSKGIKYEAI